MADDPDRHRYASRSVRPKVRCLRVVENRPTADGQYVTRYEVTIDRPFALPNLRIEAHAPSVVRASLTNRGAPANDRRGQGSGIAFATIDGPQSILAFEVITTSVETNIELRITSG